jgi:SAM-dependent methyltransferase
VSPSSFLTSWATKLAPDLPPPRRALDVAIGRGRHVEALARSGYRIFGVDRDAEALRHVGAACAAHGIPIRLWCADLSSAPLPAARFELVVVTRYLQRSLFEGLRRSVVPGGVILYETFTVGQRLLGWGPTSPDHLLEPGELSRMFAGFEQLFYEEVAAPEAVARLAARRPREA